MALESPAGTARRARAVKPIQDVPLPGDAVPALDAQRAVRPDHQYGYTMKWVTSASDQQLLDLLNLVHEEFAKRQIALTVVQAPDEYAEVIAKVSVAGPGIVLQPVEVRVASESVLTEANGLINGERQQQYGHPKVNFHKVALLWNAYLGIRNDPTSPLSPHDVTILMSQLKLARLVKENFTHRDSNVDMLGYIGIVELLNQ